MPPSRVPPLADSLEAWLHAAGKPYAFLDFRALPKQHWLRNRILSRPLGVFDPMVADWANTFDAVLCVDEAFADSMEGTAPAWVKIRQ